MFFGLFSSKPTPSPAHSDAANNLKLTVTAGRLKEFNVPELAVAANLPLDLAQAFVDSRMARGAIKPAIAPQSSPTDDLGAAAPRFRVSDAEQAKVEALEERVQHALTHLTNGAPDPHAATFVPLERVISWLDGPRKLLPSSRRARIREACAYFDIAAREVEELRQHVDAATFAALEQRLSVSEERLKKLSPDVGAFAAVLAKKPGLAPAALVADQQCAQHRENV